VDVSTQNPNYLNTQTFSFSTNTCPSLTDYVQSVSIPGVTLGEAAVETPFVKRPEPGDKRNLQLAYCIRISRQLSTIWQFYQCKATCFDGCVFRFDSTHI